MKALILILLILFIRESLSCERGVTLENPTKDRLEELKRPNSVTRLYDFEKDVLSYNEVTGLHESTGVKQKVCDPTIWGETVEDALLCVQRQMKNADQEVSYLVSEYNRILSESDLPFPEAPSPKKKYDQSIIKFAENFLEDTSMVGRCNNCGEDCAILKCDEYNKLRSKMDLIDLQYETMVAMGKVGKEIISPENHDIGKLKTAEDCIGHQNNESNHDYFSFCNKVHLSPVDLLSPCNKIDPKELILNTNFVSEVGIEVSTVSYPILLRRKAIESMLEGYYQFHGDMPFFQGEVPKECEEHRTAIFNMQKDIAKKHGPQPGRIAPATEKKYLENMVSSAKRLKDLNLDGEKLDHIWCTDKNGEEITLLDLTGDECGVEALYKGLGCAAELPKSCPPINSRIHDQKMDELREVNKEVANIMQHYPELGANSVGEVKALDTVEGKPYKMINDSLDLLENEATWTGADRDEKLRSWYEGRMAMVQDQMKEGIKNFCDPGAENGVPLKDLIKNEHLNEMLEDDGYTMFSDLRKCALTRIGIVEDNMTTGKWIGGGSCLALSIFPPTSPVLGPICGTAFLSFALVDYNKSESKHLQNQYCLAASNICESEDYVKASENFNEAFDNLVMTAAFYPLDMLFVFKVLPLIKVADIKAYTAIMNSAKTPEEALEVIKLLKSDLGVLKAPSGKELQGFKTEYPDAFEEILKKSDDPEVIKAAEEEIAILIRLMKKEGHSPEKIKNALDDFKKAKCG